MDRNAILDRLRANEANLRTRGVTHAALFGSRARDEATQASDTDILIELDPSAGITLFDYVGLKHVIGALFDGPVDVIDRDALKPCLRDAVVSDMIYAF